MSLVTLERDSGTFLKVDGATTSSEEPPAIQFDENAKLVASVGVTVDNLASLSENFFLVLQRYTVEQQRVINAFQRQQEHLLAEEAQSSRALAEYTYSLGFFKFITAKGKVAAGDVKKLNQSITAIKSTLGTLHLPIRAQMKLSDTLHASINDRQFKRVADELKKVCAEIAVLMEVCFHLYAQLNSSSSVSSRKRKVAIGSDIWTDLQSARVQIATFEEFLRVVYLISTQNRHIPATRNNLKSRLLGQLNRQNNADPRSNLDDEDQHVADSLLWTLFQAWSDPSRHASPR